MHVIIKRSDDEDDDIHDKEDDNDVLRMTMMSMITRMGMMMRERMSINYEDDD